MEYLAGRLIVNVEGIDRGYVLWNGTESYYKKLRVAYQDINSDKECEYLHFAFFTLCAATLEYSLNYILTNYCLNQFGHEDYKRYAEGYIGLSFPKKLLMCPTIISNGKFRFEENNAHYKTLNELITLRNRILHNKDFLKEFQTPRISLESLEQTIEFKIPIEPNHIETLTKESCIKFGNALGKFKALIMTPALNNELEKNEMLIQVD